MRDGKAATTLRALVLEIFRLNGALLRHGAALTAPLGQTQARWQVIGTVAEATCTVPQIARRMGMTRQSVQRTADLLAAGGLLVFVPNPDHARSPLLQLTEKGRSLERKLAERGVGWSGTIARGLSIRDLEKTVDVIREIIRRLDAPLTRTAGKHHSA